MNYFDCIVKSPDTLADFVIAYLERIILPVGCIITNKNKTIEELKKFFDTPLEEDNHDKIEKVKMLIDIALEKGNKEGFIALSHELKVLQGK
jgi:hypothetical protein